METISAFQGCEGPVKALHWSQGTAEGNGVMMVFSQGGACTVHDVATTTQLAEVSRSSESAMSRIWTGAAQVDERHALLCTMTGELHVCEVAAGALLQSSAQDQCEGLCALHAVPGQPGLVVVASHQGEGHWGLYRVEPARDDKVCFMGELPRHHSSADFHSLSASETQAVYGCGSGLLCQLRFAEIEPQPSDSSMQWLPWLRSKPQKRGRSGASTI